MPCTGRRTGGADEMPIEIDLTPRAGVANTDDTMPAGDRAPQHRGQARFAYVLADSYADKLMHVHGIGWHYWDGHRWTADDRGRATRAVLEVLRAEWNRAYGDKEAARAVSACESAAGIRGVLDIASALEPFAATVADLDADPFLVNCANGTLDLRTMQVHSHDPRDRITKMTSAAYDPRARSAEWQAFLERVLPDPEVRAYLARFVGVSLLGAVREQVFTIARGVGANGKGVFYNTVLAALGDYGHTAESDLFMTTKANANAASPAVMALRGRRFVVCSETERDHRLAAALMKNLTGGDPINARALHRDPVTFEPSHTVLMVTNFLPKVAGDDPAVWRRMRVVPFDVEIPEGERDPDLAARLRLAADAVLTWAVDGYRDYQVRGLDAPEAVLAATADYRQRSDAVARFLDEACLIGPHFRVGIGELFEAWSSWCSDDGAEPLGKKQFGEEMDKRGFKQAKSGSQRFRQGVGLATSEDDDR